ncbi:tetratricopeptide (TPR) repeat protein [Bradyrhizobium diazoefficiens]
MWYGRRQGGPEVPICALRKNLRPWAWLAALLASGLCAAAADACTAAIKSGSLQGHDLAVLYLNRGFLASRANDFDKAIQDYGEAIKVDPQYANAFSNRCAVYVRKREFNRAIEDCDNAINLNANYTSAYVSRGNAYRLKNLHSQAIIDYERAIALDKNSTAALFGAALSYSSIED